jgi:hypothetical protein
MTKEELKAKVAKQQSMINDANNQICSDVKEYIESLPYKVGDKVSCSRCDVCWIASIIPERNCASYSGMIEVRINPAKKDGTRSNREFVLWKLIVSKRLVNHPVKDINSINIWKLYQLVSTASI